MNGPEALAQGEMDRRAIEAAAVEGANYPGLPVAGYRPQPIAAIDTVNGFKRDEERILRKLDAMTRQPQWPEDPDQRWLAIGRTHLEQAFMAINRAVFRPDRVTLPAE